ncbi:HK97 family phage prohead protease [Flavobacterium branchiarum]|uniref:HK97 family phage prohead protease n=1 Tax=Flavobacterium branchiarum TaxID=1114870 RepID=A0ABV5FQV9_9FLAO|nr:HK97 family phage prohead protease [Flavobacterium branchiarum]MDN3671686.1 HK97 family phage prohead protease [Flavobacterium branchiarum]
MPRPEYFVFNDENVKNSYGFYINTLGIKMDRFNDNPVMLNNHINSNENVIGNWSDALKEGGLLKLKPHFDEETNLGKDIAGKVDRGILKGCSMGIIPNWDSVQKVGDRLIMMECELAEGSIVPVPSNKGATAIYSIDGELLKEEDVKSLCLSVTEKLDGIPENLNTKLDMNKIILSVAALMALGYKDQPKDGLDVADVEAKLLGLSNQVTSLTNENNGLKLAAETAKEAQDAAIKLAATQKVDLAITQGKIPADKKEAFVQLGISSPEVLQTTLDSIPAKQNFGAGVTVPGGNGAAVVATMDEFEKLSHTEKLSFKETNPEAYKKLFN